VSRANHVGVNIRIDGDRDLSCRGSPRHAETVLSE
jgi:hypothetical protein